MEVEDLQPPAVSAFCFFLFFYFSDWLDRYPGFTTAVLDHLPESFPMQRELAELREPDALHAACEHIVSSGHKQAHLRRLPLVSFLLHTLGRVRNFEPTPDATRELSGEFRRTFRQRSARAREDWVVSLLGGVRVVPSGLGSPLAMTDQVLRGRSSGALGRGPGVELKARRGRRSLALRRRGATQRSASGTGLSGSGLPLRSTRYAGILPGYGVRRVDFGRGPRSGQFMRQRPTGCQSASRWGQR